MILTRESAKDIIHTRLTDRQSAGLYGLFAAELDCTLTSKAVMVLKIGLWHES